VSEESSKVMAQDLSGSGSAGAHVEERRATTPRAGAIAGMLFAVLFAVSVTLMYISISAASASEDTGAWLAEKAGWFKFAVGLMPFAGMFFLWFIAVARTRLGRFEDQFFATVFLGSGLLFLAMVFAAAGAAGGIVAGYARDPEGFVGSSTYSFARDLVSQIFATYAMRMAAVFVLSQATLWLRTKVMPRWMAFLSYAVGLGLLLAFTRSMWVVLIFPMWVFFVSLYILIVSSVRRRAGAVDSTAPTNAAGGE
jgi:hypothetical protein